MTNSEIITLFFAQSLLTIKEDPKAFEKFKARTHARAVRATPEGGARAKAAQNKFRGSPQWAGYVEAHREEALERANEWQTENRERANANKLAHHYRKLESSPSYQIEKNIRCRIWWALNEAGANKTADTLSLIGCSVEEYWAHLEKQFQPGMTRENYGSYWEIDHIKPCARFDLTDPDQQRVCFHFSNAQPKTVFENRSKGDTWNG